MTPNPEKAEAAGVATYRKLPVEIEAAQLGRDYDADCAIVGWCGGRAVGEEDADFVPGALVAIDTLEGTMIGKAGDWIIKGVKGEFYPCADEIFKTTYESANALPSREDLLPPPGVERVEAGQEYPSVSGV